MQWLKEHHKTSLARVLIDIVIIYSLMSLAVYASVKTDSWIVYILAVFVIGSRQHALGALVHDGTHFALAKNR